MNVVYLEIREGFTTRKANLDNIEYFARRVMVVYEPRTLVAGTLSCALTFWLMDFSDSPERIMYGFVALAVAFITGLLLGWYPIGLIFAGVGIVSGLVVELIPHTNDVGKTILVIAVITGATSLLRMHLSGGADSGREAGLGKVLLGFGVVILVLCLLLFGLWLLPVVGLWLLETMDRSLGMPLTGLVIIGAVVGFAVFVGKWTSGTHGTAGPGVHHGEHEPQDKEPTDNSPGSLLTGRHLTAGGLTYLGYVTKDGYVKDEHGNHKGFVTKDGVIEDEHRQYKGYITKDGYIKDEHGNHKGYITKDGYVHDEHGNRTGQIRKD